MNDRKNKPKSRKNKPNSRPNANPKSNSPRSTVKRGGGRSDSSSFKSEKSFDNSSRSEGRIGKSEGRTGKPEGRARRPEGREGKFDGRSREKSGSKFSKSSENKEHWLYGKHAVMAALANPRRHIKRLALSRRASEQYKDELSAIHSNVREISPEIVDPDFFDRNLQSDSVHQGIALATTPLQNGNLFDICKLPSDQESDEKNLILVLDQVTDPHNVGAIIRSAAAFGAKALITTDRHAPPESGVLAKAASGALEAIPWIRVTNLSRALDELADMGYWRLGLDGYAKQVIHEADFGNNLVLILGAEGKGMRKGTKDHTDGLIKLPIKRTVESLNVSNAAAVALYELGK